MSRTASFDPLRKTYFFFLLAFPFAIVFYMAVNWLYLGVDLPFWDDFRNYSSKRIGSFSIDYLFKSENDTLYPIGKILDSAAQHLLRGNPVAYQFLSMSIVLGLVLWFQWKLLSAVVSDRFLAACSFFATLLMLQPGSYWGYQNLAYHQAVPLVCLLASLYLIVCVNLSIYAKMPILFVLGLVSGFTYISGAFSALAASVALLVAGYFLPGQRDRVPAGIALGSAGLVTSLMQAMVIVIDQHGKTHRPDAPWALPSSSDFWMYLFGKIARSLELPQHVPGFSFAIAVLVTGGAGWLLCRGWARTRAGNASDVREADLLCAALFLAAAISAYLAMVSAGRTNLRDPAIVSPLDVFVSAYPRFHFFWVCLIWPWVFAMLLEELRTRFDLSTVRAVAGTGAAALLAWVFVSGGLSHHAAFKEAGRHAQQGMACLQQQLMTSDRILCPSLYPADLTRAYGFAVATGASFVRYAPPSLRGLNPSPALDIFRLSGATLASLAFQNAKASPAGERSIDLVAQNDPMIVISPDNPEKLQNCQTLLLRASVDGQSGEASQLFFLPSGSASFSEENSARAPVGEKSLIEMTVSSSQGFGNRLRFDAIGGAGSVRISDLSVRCMVFRQ